MVDLDFLLLGLVDLHLEREDFLFHRLFHLAVVAFANCTPINERLIQLALALLLLPQLSFQRIAHLQRLGKLLLINSNNALAENWQVFSVRPELSNKRDEVGL
ncbi:MAG TPA: hypothetical protein VK473_05000 [Terriglobales bacterium]|nr:hypothetical protein [Terriglobales bacterium]